MTDYARLDHKWATHHARYVRRVESMPRKLTCQECGGAGGEIEDVLYFGCGPWVPCGWCEGNGIGDPPPPRRMAAAHQNKRRSGSVKPLPNRNREKGANLVERLAPRISMQPLKKGCAQKESNLQPASSGATSHGPISDFSALIRPESAQESRRNPRTSKSNRNGSATETDGFSGSAHKPYALSGHPIFPALESFGLALRMEGERP